MCRHGSERDSQRLRPEALLFALDFSLVFPFALSLCLCLCLSLSVSVSANLDLINIKDWLLANKLSLNTTKTEYMFFGTDFKFSNLDRVLPVKIGDKEIKRTETTKYLALY